MGLPNGYIELEYIESTGTQYINTDYIVQSESLQVILKFAYLSAHDSASLFGSESSKQYSICPYGAPSFFVGKTQNLESAYAPKIGEIVTLDVSAINGTLTDIWNTNIKKTRAYSPQLNRTYSIAIFGNNISGTVSQKVSMALYSCMLYDNNVLIRNFIPCKNPSGAIGLYDLVNSKFYGNAGTGAFTAGPEVINDAIYVKINGIWKQIDGIKIL